MATAYEDPSEVIAYYEQNEEMMNNMRNVALHETSRGCTAVDERGGPGSMVWFDGIHRPLQLVCRSSSQWHDFSSGWDSAGSGSDCRSDGQVCSVPHASLAG